MRRIILIPLLVLALHCSSAKNAATTSNELNGTWIPIRQELGGKSLPTAAFESQRLVIADSMYTVFSESVDKGIVACTDDRMDIYGREGVNTGKHFTAIYKRENGELTICYNLSGDSYPDAFETKSKRSLFLSVFKKEIGK